MLILHRWEYVPSMDVHRCIPLQFGDGVPSSSRCEGCGLVIRDEDLYWFARGQPLVSVFATLALLAWQGKGLQPGEMYRRDELKKAVLVEEYMGKSIRL